MQTGVNANLPWHIFPDRYPAGRRGRLSVCGDTLQACLPGIAASCRASAGGPINDCLTTTEAMKFCSECAHPVSLLVPPDDNRPRFVCKQCGVVHYENPKLVIGSIPVWDDGDQPCVLLCRRAIEPRYGFWTLPAGFMENGETTSDAAARETMEEAGARIRMHELFSLINVTHVHQVHLFYRATLLDLDYAAGIESLEVRLFSEREIPWSEIAFPTVSHTLRFFFADHAKVRDGGQYQLHLHDIGKPGGALESYRS